MAVDPAQTVERAMRSGPATFRPNALVTEVLERMEKRGVNGVLVTLSDGRLVGWLRREDAAGAAAK
jgi:CBS domain-containing protein